MGKKVLVLSASPRKGGNSDMLCDQFMIGTKESGNLVEKIFLRDMKINYCIACEVCIKNGGKCVHKDDMTEVLEKMIAADVIVMATPVYYNTMNGQLKTLIDRTFARHKEIRNKEFYFIVTAADSRNEELESTFEGLRGFTRCLMSSKEKGSIYGTGAWGKGELEGSQSMKQAYKLGKLV